MRRGVSLLLRGADVYPGDGPPARLDVAVAGGSIAAVAPDLGDVEAAETVDATGLMLCPGFIDMHAHTALVPFEDPCIAPKLAQGFTTEAINPDGLAPAPVRIEAHADRRAYLRPLEGSGPEQWTWTSFAEYLAALAQARPATTLVPAAGHNAVRDFVVGNGRRPPSGDELRSMCEQVEAALAAGARMLSFGMVYMPGAFADTEELVALATVAARFGAPLVPHVRNEADRVLESVGEFIEVARRSGAPLHLSHLKVIGNPELVERLLEQVDAAGDVDLTFDQYPYGAGSTLLAALLPPWAQDGGPAATLRRLASRSERAAIERDIRSGLPGWEDLFAVCGPERIFIANAAAPRGDATGRSLSQIAEDRGGDALGATFDLLLETALDVTMIDHYASEETVRTIFRHPRALVGSDGIFGARPHPRLWGTAPRVLGRYAIRERLVPVEEAVARLTVRAADRLQLRDRGRIAEGLRADLVLLDPAAYVDTATYDDPTAAPPGVRRVVVGGVDAVVDGTLTGLGAGGVVRDPLRAR